MLKISIQRHFQWNLFKLLGLFVVEKLIFIAAIVTLNDSIRVLPNIQAIWYSF